MRSECGGLPIIRVKSGVQCLVDTGSSSTIMSYKSVKELCKGERIPKIQVCDCQLLTLSGPCRIEGEVKLSLNRWGIEGESIRVHVVENMPREYGGILGCDILMKLGTKVWVRDGQWRVKIGRKKYDCTRVRRTLGARVGVISRRDDWRQELKREHADIFFTEGDTLTVTGETVHEIPLKQDRVTYVKERRYPQALRQHIREELEDLKKQGIIVDSTSPYNSPLWAVKKHSRDGTKQEKYRVVVDFRKLNDNTVDERYPIPRLDDILDRLGGATIFSTLDLKAGYHQIRMHPRDQHKTAFTFERGHFEFTRMPFGLKNAPVTFQKLMDEFLRGLDESVCQVYMDDLLVFSKNEDTHRRDLRSVFNRLREFGLKLSSEKSIIGHKQINFLGHTISKEGIRPDAEKVAAIERMALPRDVKSIRRLLGTLNYYRRFVPEMAEHLVALNNLLKKGKTVKISPEIEENIKWCTRKLQEKPVLAFPNFDKPFTVTTDASEYALGAVLSQEGENGEQPIAYASRRLTDTEARYSALERELLGIVWAIEHFRPYVFGRKFKVQTDHKPLVWTGRLKESSARITRWKEVLSQYNMDITYKPGKENVVADWLSRALHVNAMETTAGEHSGELQRFIREWTPEGEGEQRESETEGDRVPPEEGSIGPERQIDMEERDDIINNKRDQIIWKTQTKGIIQAAYSQYKRYRIVTIRSSPGIKEEQICKALNDASKPGGTAYLYVGNESVWEKIKYLWKNEKIGIDRTFIRCKRMVETIREPERQQEVTLAYHQGKTNHRGIRETQLALARRYFWDGMKQTIETLIRSCTVCQTTKYDRHPPTGMQEESRTPNVPLSELQVDTFTWRGYKWVTVLDVFSKMAMAYPIKDRTAEAVMEALTTWFQFYGIPDRIISDAGREFQNENVRQRMKSLGVTWHTNTPGHPKSRGGVERLHSTLGDHLRVFHVDKGLDADRAMPKALAAYNHSIHMATGFSPFEALFGLCDRRRNSGDTAIDEDMGEQLAANRITLTKTWDDIHRKLVAEKSRRVERCNIRVKDRMADLKIGSIVYRQLVSNRSKVHARYEGPFKVVVLREHNVVTIQSLTDPRKRRTVHIEQLKIPVGQHAM